MVFSSEKKELWRYASINCAAIAVDVKNDGMKDWLQQQQQRLRCPRHRQQDIADHPQATISTFVNCCGNMSISSISPSMTEAPGGTTFKLQYGTLSTTQQQKDQNNLSPPPYSSMPYGVNCLNEIYPTRQQLVETSEPSFSSTDPMEVMKMCGGSENVCDDVYTDNYNMSNNNTSSSSTSSCQFSLTSPKPMRQHNNLMRPTYDITNKPETVTTVSTPSTIVANIFGNCCGRSRLNESNTIVAVMNKNCCNNNNNSSNNKRENNRKYYDKKQRTLSPPLLSKQTHLMQSQLQPSTPLPYNQPQPKQYFNALMKQLKSNQMSLLLKAVKSRLDPMPSSSRARSELTQNIASITTVPAIHNQCILVSRKTILAEEPYVIVCRLFFWSDLKGVSELKRLSICPNACDSIYICCNPLHWCRILEETAPPPYQQAAIEELNSLDFFVEKNQVHARNESVIDYNTNTTPNINVNKTQSYLVVQIPESFSTDGEDHTLRAECWCEVSYWELDQRVGERFYAIQSSFNICGEYVPTGTNNSTNSHNNSNENMCIMELAKNLTSTPESVQKTRQKIGIGITLSREEDGIWLYNRSSMSIFVLTPTFTENYLHVCRVRSGECLRAFDIERAQSTLVNSSQCSGYPRGPIDKYCMQISFGKGWGCSYTRREIFRCPCWLEITFTGR